MRYPDWPERLNKYIISVRDQRFEYGEFDCCVFCAGAIEAMTGEDPMAEFRGRYDDRESGAAALREIGHGTLIKTLWRKFGRPVPAAFGRKGDIGLHDGAVGIVLGVDAMFVSSEGYGVMRLTQLKCVWRID